MANTLELSEDSNETLHQIFKEINVEVPSRLTNLSIYQQIENFTDAEYIYCIAYEMLMRTDKYNTLLEEYEPLKNISKNDMTNDEFLKLRELIKKMNDLGLKKTSFLGFDCDDDSDHVFKRIEYYNEVNSSPWNTRMFHKLKLDSNENIYYKLAKFYFDKSELYTLINDYYYPIPAEASKLVMNSLESKSQWKTQRECNDFYDLLDDYYIPCLEQTTNTINFKSLSSNTIYLSELDEDFLGLLKEKKTNDLLIRTKSDFSYHSMDFWNKYYVNDVKDGLNKLIDFHKNNNFIYDQNIKHSDASKNDILKNLSNFYIPCVNRLIAPDVFAWDRGSDSILDDDFIKKLKFDGVKSIVGDKGYITLKKEENIYLVQLSEHISLSLLDDLFLETLSYEDLKNTYINTDPIFNRPRLMFDEARLTNIPINLNLSKEDLLLYISQIKDDYDRDKNIVKTDIEYFFDLELESDKAKMPINIKLVDEKKKRKRHNVSNRKELKKELAMAFYIYDIYKSLLPHKEKLQDDIITEIRNLFEYDLFIESSMEHLAEKIRTYLTIMKEFIHGVNKRDENNLLKINYYEDSDNYEPKYKNLIVGKSYIAKSNFPELKKRLGF